VAAVVMVVMVEEGVVVVVKGGWIRARAALSTSLVGGRGMV